MHKHWCGGCMNYWTCEADLEVCPYTGYDGPKLFGVQVRKPTDWPCPEHAGEQEPWA